MHSPNLTQDHIARIRDLFPNCVTEARDENGKIKLAVDFDILKQELSDSIVDGAQERYHLNWPGKREALLTANAPIAKTLRPCREESVDFDTTKNLFIEGDNLDALKLLQETYLGKVKMIYIDPPYNTGNDFIYEDDFAEDAEEFLRKSNQKDEEGNRLLANTEANGRFHSDWLSMIYCRVKLACNLLADDGAIFISIDDNEQANLKKVCDEILGSNNFVADLVWKKRVSPANDSQWYSSDHEYICVYAKTKEKWSPNKTLRTEEHDKYYKNPDNDPRGLWNSAAYTCNKSKSERPNLFYAITNPHTGEEVWPNENAVWAYSQQTHQEHVKQNILYWGGDGKSKSPRKKQYLTEAKPVVPRSVWDYQEVGSTQTATTESRDLFGGASFSYPKSVGLLKKIIYQGTSKDDLILDFFAGSSTTAHALFQLNAEDGGNRKFIMVQLPEATEEKSEAFKTGYKNIAEISKERIRRAGQKILEGECHKDWNKDAGFRVLKIDTSNMDEKFYKKVADEWKQDDLLTAVDYIRQDRTPEDLLFQVLLDWGVDLTLPITQKTVQGKTVFFVDNNALVACFDTGVTEELVKELAESKPLRVVFRDNGFVSDAVKINAEQIFKQMSPGTDVKSI